MNRREKAQEALDPMFFRRKRHLLRGWRRRHRWSRAGSYGHPLTLADSPPGCQVRVVGFLDGISPEQKERLYAYGLVPGHRLSVLQHAPVTIINIEHTELALEGELARLVRVEAEDRTAV